MKKPLFSELRTIYETSAADPHTYRLTIKLKDMVDEMKMRYAPALPDALDMARAMGKKSLCFIPNGISVIVK